MAFSRSVQELGSVPTFCQATVNPDPQRHQECVLCLEQYKSPRILPCFHTFCLACLEQLISSTPHANAFHCPSCRSQVQIPPGGVGTFQVNFYVEAAIENSQRGQGTNVRICDMCRNQQATSKCVECDQFACTNCISVHGTIGATKSHTVFNITSSGPATPRVVRERYCDTHKDEKVRFFCTQCNCVLCRDCKLTTHEGHPTTDLSLRSQAAKSMILSVAEKSRTSLVPQLTQSLQKVQEHRVNTAVKRDQILSTFHQRAEQIKKEVDICLRQAEENLNLQSGNVEKELAQRADDMQQKIACVESLCSHAEQVATSGCDADIVSLPAQMAEMFDFDLSPDKNARACSFSPGMVVQEVWGRSGRQQSTSLSRQAGRQMAVMSLPRETRMGMVVHRNFNMITGCYPAADNTLSYNTQAPCSYTGSPPLQVFLEANWQKTIELSNSSVPLQLNAKQLQSRRYQNPCDYVESFISSHLGNVSVVPSSNADLTGQAEHGAYPPKKSNIASRRFNQMQWQTQSSVSEDIAEIQNLIRGWAQERPTQPTPNAW